MVKKSKRGLSPIITTIILVLIVIVLATIILLWARGLIKENISKFDQPIERACGEVNIQAFVSGNNIAINNIGDVNVYKIGLEVIGSGSSDIVVLDETNFNMGISRTVSLTGISSSEVKRIVPILLGTSEKDDSVKEYRCPESNWLSIE